MKRLLDIIRFSVISPEFLVLLLIFLINHNAPTLFEFVGNKLKTNDEVWKFIPTLPLIFCGITFKFASKLSAPLENTSNKALYEWAAFHKISDRIMASYLICILSCIFAFSIWLLVNELGASTLGCILLGSISISGLTTFLIILAAQKIRQVIELHT